MCTRGTSPGWGWGRLALLPLCPPVRQDTAHCSPQSGNPPLWLRNLGKGPSWAAVASHCPHGGGGEGGRAGGRLGSWRRALICCSLLLAEARAAGRRRLERAWLGSAGVIKVCEGLPAFPELPAAPFWPLGDCSRGSLGAWEASVPTFEVSSGWMVGKPGVPELPGSQGRGPGGKVGGGWWDLWGASGEKGVQT